MRRDDLAAEWRAKHIPPVDLEARLLGEFRKRRQPNRRMAPVWWMAAAAMLAVGFGAGAWFGSRPAPVRQPEPLAVVVRERPAKRQVETVAEMPVVVVQTERPRVIQRRAAPRAAAEPVELATEYFSLEEGPITIDRGSVVRVQVPRSTMIRVGLPVNMNRLDDAIQADLVLGEDGVARAVRFIQ